MSALMIGTLVFAGLVALLAAGACLLQVSLPAWMSERKRAHACALVLLAASLICFATAKSAYDISLPPARATGTITHLLLNRGRTAYTGIAIHTTDGRDLSLHLPFTRSWYRPGRIVQVEYYPASKSILAITVFDESGRQVGADAATWDAFSDGNLLAALLLFLALLRALLPSRPVVTPLLGLRRGTIGDTVAENFSEDVPHWCATEAGDHIATEEERQALLDRRGFV